MAVQQTGGATEPEAAPRRKVPNLFIVKSGIKWMRGGATRQCGCAPSRTAAEEVERAGEREVVGVVPRLRSVWSFRGHF